MANVCPSLKAFITVYLCLSCEIILYGVSVLYCDVQVTNMMMMKTMSAQSAMRA